MGVLSTTTATAIGPPVLWSIVYSGLYGLSVVLSLALVLVPFVPVPRRASWTVRFAAMLLATLPTEFAHVLLLARAWCWWEAYRSGLVFGMGGPMGWLVWGLVRLDALQALVLWALFLQAHFLKYLVDDATKHLHSPAHTDPPSLFSLSYVLRFLNPWWTARRLCIHRDIPFATPSEVAAKPDLEAALTLDVYRHTVHGQRKPVLLFLHGGLWLNGDKTDVGPFVPYLALKGWIVVSANYRLAPGAPFPAQLVDVKRAIRWVRANIPEYGGDAGFVAVAGDSAGAHLATLAALTTNQPTYQPGFEGVDTSVQACISMAGFYDVLDVNRRWTPGFPEWFAHAVGQLTEPADKARLLASASPLELVKGFGRTLNRKLSVASTRDESDQLYHAIRSRSCAKSHVPPLLVLHGTHDYVCPIAHVRDFVEAFRRLPGADVTVLELPGANHLAHVVSAPRGHYVAYGIFRFLHKLHEKHCSKAALALM